MSIKSPTRRTAVLLLSGAAIAGAGGYTVSASSASPGSVAQAHGTSSSQQRSTRRSQSNRRGRLAQLRHAVSITAVVPSRDGSFATLTIERGTLAARSGTQLTLREGTRDHAYKTVSITLPAKARVRLSRRPSSLGELTVGDRIVVIEGPDKTAVLARLAREVSAQAPAAEEGA